MFQSPEGDSLFFYEKALDVARVDARSFQSPEGDSLFFYEKALDVARVDARSFQSPEGDSLFFYARRLLGDADTERVSVPRRGFVVFLPGW